MNTNLKQKQSESFAFDLNLQLCDELDPIASNCYRNAKFKNRGNVRYPSVQFIKRLSYSGTTSNDTFLKIGRL